MNGDDMRRRNFIEVSAALLVSMGLPKSSEPEWMQELISSGKLTNRDIVLRSPLVIRKAWLDITIHNCSFTLAEDFVGEAMIVVEYGSEERTINLGSSCFDISNARNPPNIYALFESPEVLDAKPRWEYGSDLLK